MAYPRRLFWLIERRVVTMATESLEAAIQRAGNPVNFLRNVAARATSHGFVRSEFTNWRDESRSWRESCAFLDQSHHMTNLYVDGPDALELLSSLGVNSFATFGPDKAKQFVCVNHEGHYIGDVILFGLDENSFDLVGRRTILDWVQFHVETGDLNVRAEREASSLDRAGNPPRVYRYEIQGPATVALMEKLIGGPLPEVKFFNMTSFDIGGHRVRALRHGMAGQAGFELFGPWDEGADLQQLILDAGEEFDLVRVGSKAYSTANLESGWIPGLVPGIFTEGMRAFREWLPATAAQSLAGSLYSEDISDYYVTPFDLGYGRHVKFDHDFVGRDALEALAERPHRQKVTLVWEPQDVARVVSSLWTPGPTYKYFDIPKARYGNYQVDEVVLDGRPVGISTDCGYIVNGEAVVSLAVIDESLADPGTEVSVVWGEDPISNKPQVEPHVQTEIRATVAPCPYEQFARETYRSTGLASV
jgi:vanillate/3-O-methylgallate O-demethylase